MYDRATGLEVYIRPFDGEDDYHEYAAPSNSPVYSGNRNERYIEAVDGQRFVMGVRVHPQFDRKGYKKVRAQYYIDGRWLKGKMIDCSQPSVTATSEAEGFVENTNGILQVKGFSFAELNLGTPPLRSPIPVTPFWFLLTNS